MFSRIVLAICMFLSMGFLVAPGKTESDAKRKNASVVVTGCLQKGEVVDRFHIIGRGGKAYALRSATVKLADHVGHSVTIKGELKHDPKRDDYDFEGSEVNEEYGKGKIADFIDVEVTGLKMVASSCK